jgi:predicted aspartyl protease
MPSFTHRIPNLQQVGPVIEVVLMPSTIFLQKMSISPSTAKSVKLLAMIDTGATGTVVRDGMPNILGINPVGTTLINTPSSVNVNCNQFDVQIVFQGNVCIPSIVITEAPLQGQHIQCLIGRDILQLGVLIYTGYDNSFTLSF